MHIELSERVSKGYKDKGGKCEMILDLIKRERNWFGASCIPSDVLSIEDLQILERVTSGFASHQLSKYERASLRKIKALIKLRQDGGKRIINLEVMVEALHGYLKGLKYHWVFMEEGGQLVPWHLDNIEYNPPQHYRDHTTPARIKFSLLGKRRGKEEEKTVLVHREDLDTGKSPAQLLEDLEMEVENEELVAAYEEELETYEDYHSMRGQQFLAVGDGRLGIRDTDDRDSWRSSWSRTEVKLLFEGRPTKVVMDDELHYGQDGREQGVYCRKAFWVGAEDEEAADEKDTRLVAAPIQPFLCVFSLRTHEFCVVHVSNLTPYDYDTNILDKLVLPADNIRLIDTLVHTASRDAEDIIRGKRGGVVILCSGPPGTGKTLTAEVYSEVAKRPLYTVQCSQLGIDASSLEEELGRVLQRTVRWNAILLLDEADVYIHERGEDVNQNAIVGVFLRLLEYFSGVLFMTTNRSSIVDDAIHSRCIAHVRYEVASSTAEKKRLWKILLEQYKLTHDADLLRELVTTFPSISGRSIKQLCRLVQALNEQPTIRLFTWLASYQEGIEIKG